MLKPVSPTGQGNEQTSSEQIKLENDASRRSMLVLQFEIPLNKHVWRHLIPCNHVKYALEKTAFKPGYFFKCIKDMSSHKHYIVDMYYVWKQTMDLPIWQQFYTSTVFAETLNHYSIKLGRLHVKAVKNHRVHMFQVNFFHRKNGKKVKNNSNAIFDWGRETKLKNLVESEIRRSELQNFVLSMDSEMKKESFTFSMYICFDEDKIKDLATTQRLKQRLHTILDKELGSSSDHLQLENIKDSMYSKAHSRTLKPAYSSTKPEDTKQTILAWHSAIRVYIYGARNNNIIEQAGCIERLWGIEPLEIALEDESDSIMVYLTVDARFAIKDFYLERKKMLEHVAKCFGTFFSHSWLIDSYVIQGEYALTHKNSDITSTLIKSVLTDTLSSEEYSRIVEDMKIEREVQDTTFLTLQMKTSKKMSSFCSQAVESLRETSFVPMHMYSCETSKIDYTHDDGLVYYLTERADMLPTWKTFYKSNNMKAALKSTLYYHNDLSIANVFFTSIYAVNISAIHRHDGIALVNHAMDKESSTRTNTIRKWMNKRLEDATVLPYIISKKEEIQVGSVVFSTIVCFNKTADDNIQIRWGMSLKEHLRVIFNNPIKKGAESLTDISVQGAVLLEDDFAAVNPAQSAWKSDNVNNNLLVWDATFKVRLYEELTFTSMPQMVQCIKNTTKMNVVELRVQKQSSYRLVNATIDAVEALSFVVTKDVQMNRDFAKCFGTKYSYSTLLSGFVKPNTATEPPEQTTTKPNAQTTTVETERKIIQTVNEQKNEGIANERAANTEKTKTNELAKEEADGIENEKARRIKEEAKRTREEADRKEKEKADKLKEEARKAREEADRKETETERTREEANKRIKENANRIKEEAQKTTEGTVKKETEKIDQLAKQRKPNEENMPERNSEVKTDIGPHMANKMETMKAKSNGGLNVAGIVCGVFIPIVAVAFLILMYLHFRRRTNTIPDKGEITMDNVLYGNADATD